MEWKIEQKMEKLYTPLNDIMFTPPPPSLCVSFYHYVCYIVSECNICSQSMLNQPSNVEPFDCEQHPA